MELVNFLPWRVTFLRQRIRHDRLLWFFAVLVIFSGAIRMAIMRQTLQLQRTELLCREYASEQVKAVLQKRTTLYAQKETLQETQSQIRLRQQRVIQLVDFINNLAGIVPSGVWLQHLDITAEAFILQGNGWQVEQVQELQIRMRGVAGLHQVRLMKVTQHPSGSLHFILSAARSENEANQS